MGPLIIVANHLSNLDGALLAASIPRRMYFIAKRALFKAVVGTLLREYGAYPMDDDGRGYRALLKPLRAAVALIIVWEVFIGLLYPISGLPVTEHPQAYLVFRTLERFGDYAGPFGILLLMIYGPKWEKANNSRPGLPAPAGLSSPAAAAGD